MTASSASTAAKPSCSAPASGPRAPGASSTAPASTAISGLGVLNDVTVTQSSAVWELHELAPHTRARDLFAYAGAALPVLILVMLYDQPVLDALTSGQLAEEVVRTLAGSVGLVLAVPVTTALAVLVVKASARAREAGLPHLDGPRPAAAAEATDAGALEAVHQSRRARREAEAQAAPTR